MGLFGKIVRWTAIGLAALTALLVVAAILVIVAAGRPGAREWLRPRLEALASDALSAQVQIGAVTAVDRSGVSADDVRIAFDGAPLAAVKHAHIGYVLRDLWPPLVALKIDLDDFALDLARDAHGDWNIVRMFSAPGGSGPPPWLDGVALALTRGAAKLTGLGQAPVELADLASSFLVDLRAADAPRISVESLALRWGGASRVRASGWLGLGGDQQLAAQVAFDPLAGGDLHGLWEAWPESNDVTGWAEAAGSLDEPRADVHVAAGAARAEVWAALAKATDAARGADRMRVDASFSVEALDPRWVAAQAPPGEVSGTASASAVLASDSFPSDLTAEARLWQSAVGDVRTEWLTAQAERQGDQIAVSVQSAAPDGAWRGDARAWLAVADPHPASVEVSLVADDPGAIVPERRELLADSALHLTGTAYADRLGEGRIVTADVTLDGSRVRGRALDEARASLRLDPTLLDLALLRLRSGQSQIAGSAWLGLADERRPIGGSLAGSLDLGLVPGFAGRAATDVVVWGALDNLSARLDVRSQDALKTPAGSGKLRATVDGSRLASGDPALQAKIDGPWTPPPSLEGELGPDPQQLDLRASWQRPAISASGSATAGNAPDWQAALDLTARARDGRTQRAVLRVDRSAAVTRALVDDLRLAPRVGAPWTLDHQASASIGESTFEVKDLRLRSAGAALALDGRLERAGGKGANQVSLEASRIDLPVLCALAGIERCGGRLDAHLALAGSESKPDLSGKVAVTGLSLGDQSYGVLRLDLRTERDLLVDGGLTAPVGGLRLAARVPLQPGWPVPSLASHRELTATVTGSGLEIAGLRALAPPNTFTELRGRGRVDLTIGGTADQPRVRGSLGVDGLAVGVASTGARLRGGRVAVELQDRAIEVTELSSDEGKLSGGGRIELPTGAPPSLDLHLALDHLTVLDRSEAKAEASGTLRITGTSGSPEIQGKLVIDPATIRPQLVPGGSAPVRDPTIVVVRSASKEESARMDETIPGTVGQAIGVAGNAAQQAVTTTAPGLLDGLVLDVTVDLGDQVFIRRTDAEIRLDGELYATKGAGEPVRVTGQIEAVRGWYVFQGRRLEVEHAYVAFSGETPIDPYLDVRAVYRSPQYRITVAVQGTARRPSLDLTSDPPLDQSDILAVLLFGKPTSELTSGQGADLQKQAIGLLASYVAPELEKSVIDTFGLTSVTFQMPTGSSAGTVGIGRYFGQDLFVSVAQDFGGPQGGTPRQLQGLVGSSVTVQYYLTPSVTLQGAASSQGESAVDVIWHRRY